MRNILSCIAGTKFSGQEILDWAKYQVENKTSREKQGRIVLRRFYNLKPEKMYLVQSHYPQKVSRNAVHKPLVINVDNNLKPY